MRRWEWLGGIVVVHYGECWSNGVRDWVAGEETGGVGIKIWEQELFLHNWTLESRSSALVTISLATCHHLFAPHTFLTFKSNNDKNSTECVLLKLCLCSRLRTKAIDLEGKSNERKTENQVSNNLIWWWWSNEGESENIIPYYYSL